MLQPDFFEGIMLVCFGAAWPVSIYKSYTSRTNQGKSVYFLLVILLGYVSGIIFQILSDAQAHLVIALFGLNTLMILIDIGLYIRNKRLTRTNQQTA